MGLIEAGVAVATSAATTVLVLLAQQHIRHRRERRMWRRMERYANHPSTLGPRGDFRPGGHQW